MAGPPGEHGFDSRPTLTSSRDFLRTGRQTKLHLGCGSVFIPGFLHVDLMPGPHVDHVGPVERLDFIPDQTIELIYASHVLEHFGRGEFMDVLREWYRVLCPGGVLRLSVPDVQACAEVYIQQGLVDGLSGLIGLVCGGQRNERDYHKMIFDLPFLTTCLHSVGFKSVRRWDWRKTEHSQFDDYSQAYVPHMDKEQGRLMSLNLQAVR